MKIKLDKFSFEFSVKDLEWFAKLDKIEQVKCLVIFGGALVYLNHEAKQWYLTIKEEKRKDKLQTNELKVAAKKIEVKNS